MKKTIVACLMLGVGLHLAGTIHRASLAWNGAQANGDSNSPAISADGRLVAFTSNATNLVPRDTNNKTDIFVRDLKLWTTVRVSVASDGSEANGACWWPSISADGELVAFVSDASNLVANDTNGKRDVFVRNLKNGTTIRASILPGGMEGAEVLWGVISPDGGRVFFKIYRDCLCINELSTGSTSIFSYIENSQVIVPNPDTICLSPDGRYLSFFSYDNRRELSLHDFQTGECESIMIPQIVNFNNDYIEHSMAADGSSIFINQANFSFPSSKNRFRDSTDYVFSPKDKKLQALGSHCISHCGISCSQDGERVLAAIVDSCSDIWGPIGGSAPLYMFNWKTGEKQLISRGLDGQPEIGGLEDVLFSQRVAGKAIAFWSSSSNLVRNDTNSSSDVFINDNRIPLAASIAVQRGLDRAWLVRIPYNAVTMELFRESSCETSSLSLFRMEAEKLDALLRQYSQSELQGNPIVYVDKAIQRGREYAYYCTITLSTGEVLRSETVSDKK